MEKEGSTSKPLELVHTDLCGPSRKKSPRGEEYFILFIDDFSKMSWIGLLKHKDEAFEKFKAFKVLAENDSDRKINCLRSDQGGEFTSDELFNFCEQHGIKRQFSTTRTPQQNGVVERMNRTVQQMAQAMVDESRTLATFWGEAAFAAITILNQANFWVNNIQTPHELWYGKTPTVKCFKVFGSKCYIKRTDEKLGKFEPKADYACKNPKQIKTEDYDNEEDEDHFPSSNHTNSEEQKNEAPEEEITVEENTLSRYVQKNHLETQILGEKGVGVQTERTITQASSYLALLSSSKPQNVDEACRDECWVKAMNEELEQIGKNNTWELVPRPHDKNII
eukprot:PITA_07263